MGVRVSQLGQAIKLSDTYVIRDYVNDFQTLKQLEGGIGKIYGSVIFFNNPGSRQPVGTSKN